MHGKTVKEVKGSGLRGRTNYDRFSRKRKKYLEALSPSVTGYREANGTIAKRRNRIRTITSWCCVNKPQKFK